MHGGDMQRSRSAIRIAAPLLLVVAAAVTAVHLPMATSHAQQPEPVPLLELTNPKGDGLLYTLSQAEASGAQARYGFQLVPTPRAFMWRGPFPGSQPVYRLRYKLRHSYLLTPSQAEVDALVASGRFELEGILGYAGAIPGVAPPGGTVLWRYSKEGRGWPVAVEARRSELEAQGFHRDGPIGYVYESLPQTPPPPTPPTPAPVDRCDPNPTAAGLRMSLVAKGSRRVKGSRTVTLRRGARLRVRGRVRNARGLPLRRASVCVTSQRPKLGAPRRRIATVATNRRGRFEYTVSAGRSRRIGFVHRTNTGAVSASLSIRVRSRAQGG